MSMFNNWYHSRYEGVGEVKLIIVIYLFLPYAAFANDILLIGNYYIPIL